MNPRIAMQALLIVALAAGLPSCGGAPLSGPPELKLGRSECVACNMIISEDRCSCGLLVEDDGHRDYLLYDDIGCMLDDEHAGLDGHAVVERYVHDHQTKAWVDVDRAVFVMVDPKALPTPMGSGIVAFASRSEAEVLAAKHAGTVLDYAALGAARRGWMEERYGKPEGEPTPRTSDSALPGKPAASVGTMDAFYLHRCPLCGSLLGAKGEAVELTHEGRNLRFCGGGCRDRFAADPAHAIPEIDRVLIADQRSFYPTDRSLIDDRPLGADPVAFVWGNRLFLAADERDRAAILADPGAAVRTLDRLVIERQRPVYGMPDKCPVQGDILPNEDRIDIVVANRMIRVCCARCARVVRARPYQYLAMVEYANREAARAHPDAPTREPRP